MRAGAQVELPAMAVIFLLPVDGQGGQGQAARVHAREAVVDEAARDSVGLLPRVALDFDAQRAAVVRARPCLHRHCEADEEKTNCTAP